MNDLTIGWRNNAPQRPVSYYLAAAACYLAHVEGGQSIRAIAAKMDLHPSTVMRRIRKIELMRDDPLVDQYAQRMLFMDNGKVRVRAGRSSANDLS